MKIPGILMIGWLLLAQKPGKPPADGDAARRNAAGWTLTFADEFDGSELDLSKWAPHDPWGEVRDRQLQAFSPESARVGNGELHLVAARVSGSPIRYSGADRTYVSGIVTTFGTFSQTYGRFEIRCRIARGRGLRSGFHLLPVPLSPLPAIDVFETSGNDPVTMFASNHWGSEQTHRSYGEGLPVPDLTAGFHTFSIEWDPDMIAWFVDGKEKFRSSEGIPHQPMYLLLDLAVGGNVGGTRARSPDDSTSLPASFDIDYVRVFRRR